MTTTVTMNRRRLLLPEMEGTMARWYDRQRGTASQIAQNREQARRLTAGLPAGAGVLEVAPGPGYHAIEMARLGRVRVTGLDISRSFVEIATGHAREAGVEVDFRHGDVSSMPFPDASFDLVVCQAAFKNFRRPVSALDEMHRVLRPGGTAVIQDLRRDAADADIEAEVEAQGLRGFNGFLTRYILGILRNRAYTAEKFERLAAQSLFDGCRVSADGVGLEVRLSKTGSVLV
jgi:ubiquinone/menaquinone biosynthesis C-methylase UbiE